MVEVYLGLGSNVGDPIANVVEASKAISRLKGIQNLELSPVYRTAPVGKLDQAWFANAVARLRTELSPRELLDRCLEIEKEFKRERVERWGPRTLDVDILLYGEDRIQEDGLEVPHPRMFERAFVLAPLLDLDSDLRIAGAPVSGYLSKCVGQEIEKA